MTTTANEHTHQASPTQGPARIGAEFAAGLGIDATVLTVALEAHVHRHLEDLARTRFDLGE